MALTKRNGIWHIQLNLSDPITNKRRRIRVSTKTDSHVLASKLHERYLQAWYTEQLTISMVPDATLGDTWQRAYRAMYQASPKTISTACDAFDKMVKRKLINPSHRMSSMDSETLENIHGALISDGLSANTVNQYLWVLRKLCKQALKDGAIIKEPKYPKLMKPANPKDRVATSDEVGKICLGVSRAVRDFITVAVGTGGRISEILSLRRCDIGQGQITFRNTKNGKDRTVPMNTEVSGIIMARTGTNMSSPSEVRVFAGITEQDIRQQITNASRANGIEGITPHTFRHTFCTNLLQNGADVRTVMELMGHSSPEMTLRYAHTDVDAKRRAVESL